MSVFLWILLILAIVIVAFFVITFTMYIFNLDMKMTALLYPLLQKHYDRIKRDKHL